MPKTQVVIAGRTIPQVADFLDASVRQVDYAVSEYGIQPACKVGIIRVFDDAAVEQIRLALAEIGRPKPPRRPTLVELASAGPAGAAAIVVRLVNEQSR